MLKKTLIILTTTIFSFLAIRYLPSAIRQVSAAGPSYAQFSSDSINIQKNQNVTIDIKLEPNGGRINGVDLIVQYNAKVANVHWIDLNEITPNARTYWINNFSNEEQAKIRLSSTTTNPDEYLDSSMTLAQIHVSGRDTGNTELKFLCSQNSTTDSNVSSFDDASDLIDCSALNYMTISVSSTTSAASPSPSASPEIGGACAVPSAPSNFQADSIDGDTILLRWTKPENANNYSVVFGTDPERYQFGAVKFGDTNQLLVNYLASGITYHFGLYAHNDCGISSLVKTSAKTVTVYKPSTTTTVSTNRTNGRTFPSPSPSPQGFGKLTGTASCTSDYQGICRPGQECLSSEIQFQATCFTNSVCCLPQNSPHLTATGSADLEEATQSADLEEPDIELTEEELEEITNLDSLIPEEEFEDVNTAPAAQVLVDEQVEEPESAGPNWGLIITLIIVGLIVAIGVIILIRSRRTPTPPMPPTGSAAQYQPGPTYQPTPHNQPSRPGAHDNNPPQNSGNDSQNPEL